MQENNTKAPEANNSLAAFEKLHQAIRKFYNEDFKPADMEKETKHLQDELTTAGSKYEEAKKLAPLLLDYEELLKDNPQINDKIEIAKNEYETFLKDHPQINDKIEIAKNEYYTLLNPQLVSHNAKLKLLEKHNNEISRLVVDIYKDKDFTIKIPYNTLKPLTYPTRNPAWQHKQVPAYYINFGFKDTKHRILIDDKSTVESLQVNYLQLMIKLSPKHTSLQKDCEKLIKELSPKTDSYSQKLLIGLQEDYQKLIKELSPKHTSLQADSLELSSKHAYSQDLLMGLQRIIKYLTENVFNSKSKLEIGPQLKRSNSMTDKSRRNSMTGQSHLASNKKESLKRSNSMSIN